jgi:hypothetical protein
MMAQEKPVTPEKQLLKLIEEPGPKSSLGAAVIKHHTLSLFSFEALKGRFAFLKSKFKADFREKGFYGLDIKLINMILGLCVFILAVYFVTNLLFSIVHSREALNLELEIDKNAKSLVSQVSSLLKAGTYYLEKARERNIFKIGMKGTDNKSKTLSLRVTEATQNLKLVGISWSDDPDVMIEDTKTQRTFFLKKGQMIDDIKLEAVFKDKVILNYLGEEIELK